MNNTIPCPRCGTENPSGAMNCATCRINLRYAQEYPAEIERIRQEDALKEQSIRNTVENGPGSTPATIRKDILLPALLLLGSFAFAFCLGEAVHESGHFLAHRYSGAEVGIKLDPFGGSRILHASSASREILGITSLAGPLLNLLLGLTLWLSLWKMRRPALLPLLLWGPISLIQEGVTFSLGMLTPGGDADLITRWGIPSGVLISLGVLFLVAGIAMICWLLPLVNLSPADTFSQKFMVVTGGMVSFMVLRLLGSSLRAPNLLMENTVPLVFSVLLATMVAFLYNPLHAILSRISKTELEPVTMPAVAWSAVLGLGMVMFQIFAFN